MESNEFTVKIGEREFVLKPALAELKMLQQKIGGLIKVSGRFADLSIDTKTLAAIIWHGGRGFQGQTMPSIDMIEDLLLSEGQMDAFKPCSDFVYHVCNSGTKSAAVKKDSETETPAT